MTLTEFWAIIGIAVGFVGYFPYLRDVVRGKTKPHVFSWFIWSLLTGIAAVAQWADGGGEGVWVTAVTAMACFFILVFSFFHQNDKNITRSDWVTFIAALLAIPLWLTTGDPLWSVIWVTMIDLLGFYPTFRKSYIRPHEETLFTYSMSGLKFVFGLMALENFTLVTVLYPLSLVLSNGAFVLFVLWRRRVVV